jgi:hypothetical protein
MSGHMDAVQAIDMRSPFRKARYERRIRVIRIREADRNYDENAMQTGLSPHWRVQHLQAPRRSGALRDAPNGRKSGDGRLLDAEQEAVVCKFITDKTPDQLKMPYARWTRERYNSSSSSTLVFGCRCTRRVCTWCAGASRFRSL